VARQKPWNTEGVSRATWYRRGQTRIRTSPDGSCDLYRAYNADGHLLYVGISGNALHRLAEHNYASKWTSRVCTLEIEHYASRETAALAERQAIRREFPALNLAMAQTNADKAPCGICQRTQACWAWNCPKRQFQFVPIIAGEDIQCM
jgi:predicted GIY-YIG superfamily endonuclease